MTAFAEIIDQARAQSLPELVAVVAAALYLAFAIREKIVCWFFAAISTAIYIWLFIEAKLYMESILNVFYLVMAGYGWYQWNVGRTDTSNKPVVTWPLKIHAQAISCIVLLGLANGFLLYIYSDAAFPFIDSLTTWFAIWATYLIAQKVLENWWYWLLIDLASIFIYWSRDLKLTSVLFVLYFIMIPIGLFSWTKSMHKQSR
ncbi:MAG: nicotinamide mononucleotide transporter [Gammaproteobacteria bacterium]|jgi:nicotinamide mononucleotide transporter|nr:nicotinamide mononucleotide transporter [Gammaproteobacteria bacterium]